MHTYTGINQCVTDDEVQGTLMHFQTASNKSSSTCAVWTIIKLQPITLEYISLKVGIPTYLSPILGYRISYLLGLKGECPNNEQIRHEESLKLITILCLFFLIFTFNSLMSSLMSSTGFCACIQCIIKLHMIKCIIEISAH